MTLDRSIARTGVDPRTAVLILKQWARRSQIRAERRKRALRFEASCKAQSLIDRAIKLIAPWETYDYPGYAALIRHICGLSPKSTGAIPRWRREGLPPAQAEKLARWLQSRIALEQAVVEELLAHAEARYAALKPYNLITATSEQRSEWWDVRRQKAAEKAARAAQRSAEAKARENPDWQP